MWNSSLFGVQRPQEIITEGSTATLSSSVKERNLKEFLERRFNESVHILSTMITDKSPANEVPVVVKMAVVARRGRRKKNEVFYLTVKMLQEAQFVIGDNSKLLMRLDHLTKMKKEIGVYDSILRSLEKFQSKKKIKDKYKFCNLLETCIGTRVSSYESNVKFALPDPSTAILYNDLRFERFYFEDEYLDFDYPTTKVVVRNLARIHGAALAFRLLDPERFNEDVLPVLELKEREYVVTPTFPVQLNRNLVEFCMKDGFVNIDVLLAEIAQYSIPNWYSAIAEDQKWLTICHSQYWIPNILVKRNKYIQAITSIPTKMDKLELNNCCSDLAFFMFTSIDSKMLEIHFGDILNRYAETFDWALKIHAVPNDIRSTYVGEKFLREFDIQAPKILHTVLADLLQVTCEDYGEGGLPILSNRYKEKVQCLLKLMVRFGWLSPECRTGHL